MCLTLGPLASHTQSLAGNSGNNKKRNLGSPWESVRGLGFGDSEGAPGWAVWGGKAGRRGEAQKQHHRSRGNMGESEVGDLLQELPETGQGLLTVWG